jgi:hypothetical protein
MKILSTSALTVAVLAAMTVAPAAAEEAQFIPLPDMRDQRQTPDPPPSKATRLTGEIKHVDGHVVIMMDGQRLLFVPGVTEHQGGELKAGATIKASYAETAGRKIATSIRVEPL